MSDDFPTLRIVPVGGLAAHEWHDDQRTPPLVERLKASGVLRNPIIVSPFQDGSDRHMVLDGANRTAALNSMGIPHALVQTIEPDSPNLDLKTWNHVLWNLAPQVFMDGLRGIAGLQLTGVEEDEGLGKLWNQEALAWVQTHDQKAWIVTNSSDGLLARLDSLNKIVDSYKGRASMDRTQARKVKEVEGLYKDLCAVVVFPPFQVREVLELCGQGHHFPAGITRFTVSPRALRVNYPLDELAANKSLEEKNAALQQWVQERVARKGVRYYAEATVLFDE